MSAGHTPPAVTQAVWSLIGAIPGCVFSHVSIDEPPPSMGATSVTIGIDGWSPSLHAVSMEIAGVVLHPFDEASLIRQLRACLAPTVTAQNARARSALRIGRATPGRGDTTDGVAHLLMDASLLAITLEDEAAAAGHAPAIAIQHVVAKPLHWLHHQATDHGSGDVLSDQVTTVRETRDGRVVEIARAIVAQGADVSKRFKDGQAVVTMEGRSIIVAGRVLPHTLATMAKGRRLGDIATLHRHLDDRIVEDVEVGDDWFEVSLVPRYARLGDVIPLGLDDAIRALGFEPNSES